MTEPAVAPTPVAPVEPAATPPVEPTPAAPPTDWRAGLPTDLQAHPSFADTKSVESLARQYIEQGEMVGRKGIIPPADDSPEEMTRYYNELGRPEAPDGYKFESLDPTNATPETLALIEQLRPVFHSNGITGKQADGLTKALTEITVREEADKNLAHTERAKLATAELTKKWGLASDTRHEMAVRAINYLYGEEGAVLLAGAILPDGSRVGDNTAFIESLYDNLGAHMTEDQLTVGGSAAPTIMTPEAAQAEIDKLMLDKDFTGPYYDSTNVEHRSAQEKMKGLYAMANPQQGA